MNYVDKIWAGEAPRELEPQTQNLEASASVHEPPLSPSPPSDAPSVQTRPKYQRLMKVSDARKLLVEEIGPKVGIAPGNLEAWPSVHFDRFLRYGAHDILAKVNYSLYRLFRILFPEVEWKSNQFDGKAVDPQTVWRSNRNVRAYLEYLGEKLGIKEGDYAAWYKVTVEDLSKVGGEGLLKAKIHKLPTFVKAAFPEHTWDVYAFSKSRFLPAKKIRRELLAAGKKHGIEPGDYYRWYELDDREFRMYGIRSYIEKFYLNRYQLISIAFPEHTWHPFLFRNMKSHEWDKETLQSLAKYLEKELEIAEPEDWNRIGPVHLDKIKPKLNKIIRGGLPGFLSFLKQVYPNIQWDVSKMAWSHLGWSQLYGLLEHLFPGEVSRAPKYGLLPTDPSDAWLVRGLMVSKWKLLFHYQGPIAYAEQVAKKSEWLTRYDSSALLRVAEDLNLSLISVPFWWREVENSLLGELYSKRKDLFAETGPLKTYETVALTAPTIQERVLLKDIDLNAGYIKVWKSDQRFAELFEENDSPSNDAMDKVSKA